MMQVSLVNDGPVTILLDTSQSLTSELTPEQAEKERLRLKKAEQAEELKRRTEDNRRKKEEREAAWKAKRHAAAQDAVKGLQEALKLSCP